LAAIFLPALWSVGFIAIAGVLSLPYQFALRAEPKPDLA
jgi:hypothetical protein